MEENKPNPFPTLLKILDWIKEHKIKFILFVIGITVLIFVLFVLIINSLSQPLGIADGGGTLSSNNHSLKDALSFPSSSRSFEESADVSQSPPPQSPEPIDIPGIKVIEANLEIKTEDVKTEEEKVIDVLKKHNGYAESSNLRESPRNIVLSMTLRVPADKFDDFFQELRKVTEPDTFNVKDFRIDIDKRITELDTVRDTIREYDLMLELLKDMPVNDERIRHTQNLTNHKISLRHRENNLMDSIQQSRRLSEYSTIRLTMEQKITPKIWPEDLKIQFLEDIKRSIANISMDVTSFVGNALMLMINVILWILYILIFTVPIWIAFRILRKIYIYLYRKE